MESSGQMHAPATSLAGKRRRHTLDMMFGGRKRRSGRGGEKKKIQAIC